ncbi:MAG: ABC transporter ATP-binding protein [Hyphomicrobiales bacterium]
MSPPILVVNRVRKQFGAYTALASIDLEVQDGERLGIIGPNGSGKTTLINCIAGLLLPDAGTISYLGKDITALPAYKRARLGIARSFQIPRPFTGMSVLENLLVALDYLGGERPRDLAVEVLDSIGLSGRCDDSSELLSQLELRKLELARALVARPRLLIADETMAGLSEAEIDNILPILLRLNESGVAVIMIEHIMHAVMRFSQRLICMETGKIIANGTPRDIAADLVVQKVYFGEQARR